MARKTEVLDIPVTGVQAEQEFTATGNSSAATGEQYTGENIQVNGADDAANRRAEVQILE